MSEPVTDSEQQNPAPNRGVLRISPYRQGESEIVGVDKPIKLSSNESSHGPSPDALTAYREAISDLNRYADGAQTKLREAIGEVHGLDPSRIICGNGSDELIQLVIRTYVSAGDEVLLSENGFVMSNIHSLAQGAELVVAPERHYTVDVDAMLERVSANTRFCTIANPNNPTGTYIPERELRRLHAGLPEHCVFLIDAAYAEYVCVDDYESGAGLVDDFDNVIMTRTFSKIYGLPSLRVGWAYCKPRMWDYLNRIRTPFNVNGPALVTAQAAVQDQPFVDRVKDYNQRALHWIETRLRELPGLEFVPSVANFYLLRFDTRSGKSGTGADKFLRSRGIIPRPAGRGDEHLRITVGTDEENEAVVNALTDYLTGH